MSVAFFGTVFGRLEYKGVLYKLLKLPLDEESKKRIDEYKQKLNDLIYSTAPWIITDYVFKIIDKKLYLTSIHFQRVSSNVIENEIVDIFGKDKVFIPLTGDIKMFSRSKEMVKNGGVQHSFYTITLKVDKGTLLKTSNVEWKNSGMRVLKNYIPE